ncbi:MAG: AMP phosphorylase [Candidatus Methanomethylicia archaeon]
MPKFKARVIDASIGRRIVLINDVDARTLGLRSGDRVRIGYCDRLVLAIIEVGRALVNQGEVGIFNDVNAQLKASNGDLIYIEQANIPESIKYIRKKMSGKQLSREEIFTIVRDVVNGDLSDLEIAAFLLAEEFHGMDLSEVIALTQAMVSTGLTLSFEEPVYDKHSIGGVPGNKVSLLIVPIVAAAGLIIPKTSSRAITSPSGTADTMEVLAPVEFTAEELKNIVKKVGGAIVWGGSLNLAPADDIFIRIEHQLEIDPKSQMLASIMAKKLAVDANYVVIDIPTGKEAKVETISEARKLANDFVELGERLGVRIKCGITYGGQPVGHTVGPALEAREALKALQGEGPASLIEKSTSLAGLLFEMGGYAPRGGGQDIAKKILTSGKAYEKMKQIIETQGGKPNITPDEIPVGSKRIMVEAPCDGFITDVSNVAITAIARAAGAPVEKGAGIVLHGKRGYKVRKGEPILEIYAERESKLNEAYRIALTLKPVTIEGMLLYQYPEY